VPVFVLVMEKLVEAAATADEPQDPPVPVLVTLGNDDVPVCADGSCAL
jgi:hypothetical protein